MLRILPVLAVSFGALYADAASTGGILAVGTAHSASTRSTEYSVVLVEKHVIQEASVRHPHD